MDDPYTFGLIAAANSLSDIYAMGGEPLLAMNIVCFPNCLPLEVLAEIIRGGADKCTEANCLVVGGHTVQDDEPKFGLSVSSVIHPKDVWKNSSSQPGDVLVLTKPIGVGILNTALKGGLLQEDSETYKQLVHSMSTLNVQGKRAAEGLRVHACTDITGFGLMGHAFEMAMGSDTTLVLEAERIPILPEAISFASMGLVPAGAYDNRSYVGDNAQISPQVDRALVDAIYDPQTSGGLLFSIAEEDVEEMLTRLQQLTTTSYGVVGRVIEGTGKAVIIE